MAPEFKHFIRPTTERPPSLVSVTIVSALVGLVTGAAGFSLMKSLYPPDLPFLGVDNGRGSIKLRIDQPLTIIAGQITDQLAAIYTHIDQGSNSYSQLYSDKEYLGTGVVVTSDGWIMLPQGTPLLSTVDVRINDKIYSVKDKFTDPLVGLRFIKIAADNLRPIKFASNSQLAIGATLVYERWNVSGDPLLGTATISGLDIIDTSTRLSQIHSTAVPDDWNLVAASQADSGLYFTADGLLAGVSYGVNKALPPEYIAAAVNKLLTKSAYTDLGIFYVDNYRVVSQSEAKKGVTIFHPQRSAVVVGSVAQKAGLRANDVILAINGQEIDSNHPLMKLLINFKPGEDISLKVIRDNQALDLKVKL